MENLPFTTFDFMVAAVILLSAIPGAIAVLCVAVGVREPAEAFQRAGRGQTTPAPSAPLCCSTA